MSCRRALCKNCLRDCTVDLTVVKKTMNVHMHAPLLKDLAVTRNSSDKSSANEVLVLKEDVAGLFDTSWELFVQGSSARKAEM